MQTRKFGKTEMQTTLIGFRSRAIVEARRSEQVDAAGIAEIEAYLGQGS